MQKKERKGDYSKKKDSKTEPVCRLREKCYLVAECTIWVQAKQWYSASRAELNAQREKIRRIENKLERSLSHKDVECCIAAKRIVWMQSEQNRDGASQKA